MRPELRWHLPGDAGVTPVVCFERGIVAFGRSLRRALSHCAMFKVNLKTPPYSGAFSDDETEEAMWPREQH